MTASAAVFAILVALLLGAMIPGPSFVLVARNAIGLSRRDGLATALGMGAGALFSGAWRWRGSIRCCKPWNGSTSASRWPAACT